MDIEQLINDFLAQDPDLLIPVLAGCAIIVGGLLIGIFRGMTGGVIVALLFGGLMTTSPILIGKVTPPEPEMGANDPALLAADVAKGAAQLSIINSEAVTSLTRVVNSMRLALDGLGQVVAPTGGAAGDSAGSEVASRFASSLDSAGTQLDQASASLDRINTLRTQLEDDIEKLQSALDGAASQ
ncbi:hypothetical protein [Acuticoccus sp. I52.16.1]|uniref:hypothetical protein n=1 Tax=Acuticoccus sp. I52.16.1 TaxID=2928472 RepID=UPI001FD15108|nr:hypothetical protein [Acuticoccus sp. I52.16.1]UOM33719.1 hypothetical protein MRB58_18035 [Acuticoccus sp. I52.16.1]